MFTIGFRVHSPLLDWFALRIMTSPLGLHLMFSAFTTLVTFGCLIGTWNLVQAFRLPSILQAEARVEEVPLVKRSAWSWNRDHSLFTCYVNLLDEEMPCVTVANPGKVATIPVYRHELLGKSDHRRARAVRVPADGSWGAIFRSAEGVSPGRKAGFMAVVWLFTALCLYLCIRGYVLVTQGRRRRRY